jgi:hypothetical protein
MQVFIQQPTAPDFSVGRIFIRYDNGKDRYNVNINADGKLEQTLMPEFCATPIKPFLELPEDLFDEFIKAVASYAKSKGIETESETFLKGKFQATESHLEYLKKSFDAVLTKLIS